MRTEDFATTNAVQVCSNFQHTVHKPVTLRGYTLRNHLVNLTIAPAEPNTGLVFLIMHRGRMLAQIPVCAVNARSGSALYNRLKASWSELHTTDGDGITWGIGVVEHLIAALRRMGIDNARIDVDFPNKLPLAPLRHERVFSMPLMNGTAGVFMNGLRSQVISQPPHRRKVWMVKSYFTYNSGPQLPSGFLAQRLCLIPRHHAGFKIDACLYPDTGQTGDALLENQGVFEVTDRPKPDPLTLPAALVDTAQPVFKHQLYFRLGTLGTNRHSDFFVLPDHVRPRERIAHRITDIIGDWGRLGPFQMNLEGHHLNHRFMAEALHAALEASVLELVIL